MRNEVRDIYLSANKNKKLYLFDNIPPKIMANARKSYASALNEGHESVLLLYDDTFFGSGKDGFILTTKHIYYRNIAESPLRITVDSIIDLDADTRLVSGKIFVDTDDGDTHIIQIAADDKQALFDVFERTILLMTDIYKEKNEEDEDRQTAASGPRLCHGCGAKNITKAKRCEYCDSPL